MGERVDEILSQADRCLLPLEEASSLPPAAFDDPEWYELERVGVFHSGWVAVARTSELSEPNEFVTASIAGEPIVVVRRREGGLTALSNVCPHRGATVVGDRRGSAPSLQCPYHQWTFGHDGRLRAAPGMDRARGFEIGEICLPELAVDEWHGFVLVNVDRSAAPLSDATPTLGRLFDEQRVGEWISLGRLDYPSPWNWKISVENFLESYHHRGIHPTTLEPTYPGLQSFGALAGDEPWSGVDHVSVVEDNEPFVALDVYPSLLVAVSRGFGGYWFRIDPQAVDATQLTIEAFALPEFAAEEGLGEAMLTSVAAINDEDIDINERTAAGLRSKFARAGRVSHLEEGPWHFRRWLVERLREVAV